MCFIQSTMTNLKSLRRVVSAGLVTLLLSGSIAPIAAADEEKGYTIGLSMYSLRQLFKDGSLTALDYPKFARDTFGITEIDVWDGGFPAGKKDDIEFYRQLKKAADEAGSNIFLLMVGAVDATGKTGEERKKGGDAFMRSLDYANALGAKYVRVFLKAPDVDREDAIDHSIEALTPLADLAEKKGLIVVIEPGSSKWARKGPFLADLAKKMDHAALRLMPDFGKMRYDDPYGGTVAMMPYSDSVSAKSFDFDEDGNEKYLDYSRLMKSVNDADYRGIVAIEYEGEKLGPVEGVKATKALLERLRP